MFETGYVYDSDKHKFCYVAEFIEDGEIYYIVGYKKEWIIMKKVSKIVKHCSKIPEEAMKHLKQLPNKPYNYKPYMQQLSKS